MRYLVLLSGLAPCKTLPLEYPSTSIIVFKVGDDYLGVISSRGCIIALIDGFGLPRGRVVDTYV